MINIIHTPYKETEADTRRRYIDPMLKDSGWEDKQIQCEYSFTAGRIVVDSVQDKPKAKRKEGLKVDYLLLSSKGDRRPLAVVEAKKTSKLFSDGMQQAIGYAIQLDVPFAYATNGKRLLEHDMLTGKETELEMSQFPTEDALWARFCQAKNITKDQESVITQPYYVDSGEKPREPRYYQRIAINRTVDAIAQGQKRVLLVMATGTGKTYTAFQIIDRLKKSGKVRKVLYLADRNILIDQTMFQDFKPFTKIMTKVQGKQLDSAYEVYMSLYQQLVSNDEGPQPYEAFDRSFFDLVVVDECHRGSADEESQWRKVLDYFDQAIHLGVTATPKETKEVSNIHYFGEPVYTYSLKEGIDDGFLAPYIVQRHITNLDALGWRPEDGQLDDEGRVIDDRYYESKDFDKTIVFEKRIQVVAKAVTNWLRQNGRDSKTIVFCANIAHAEAMRCAINNLNTDITKDHPDYVMRITGDNDDGKRRLDDFINPGEPYPTVVTTSKLMTTGVDAKTTRLIVLDQPINSMTEFKQIVGRGTRIHEPTGKLFFTIMDFRGVTRLFADTTFDGEPICTIEVDDEIPQGDETDQGVEEVTYPELMDMQSDDSDDSDDSDGLNEPRAPYYLSDVDVDIVLSQTQYFDAHGKPITVSLKDYTKEGILKDYASLDIFLTRWDTESRKSAILEEIKKQNIHLDQMIHDEGLEGYDLFDVILQVAYNQKPLTKKERAQKLKNSGFLDGYQGQCRSILESLINKYAEGAGIEDLESVEILQLAPLRDYGSSRHIVDLFGGKDAYLAAIHTMTEQLYQVRAQ